MGDECEVSGIMVEGTMLHFHVTSTEQYVGSTDQRGKCTQVHISIFGRISDSELSSAGYENDSSRNHSRDQPTVSDKPCQLTPLTGLFAYRNFTYTLTVS